MKRIKNCLLDVNVGIWKNKFFLGLVFLSFLPLISPAHYITGYVEDAKDLEPANNKVVVLWKQENGNLDNVTGVIGPAGQAGHDNVYMIDCEMLDNSCSVGDELSLKVFDSGDHYVSRNIVNVTVTSAGYDLVNENLTLNSPVSFVNFTLDDDFDLVLGEIDLVANSQRKVFCEAIVEDSDGDSIFGVNSELYDFSNSYYGDVDINNFHYTNNSCFLNSSYSENQTKIICEYDMEYYSSSGDWMCEIFVNDSYVSVSGNDMVNVNSLLALEVKDDVNFTVDSSGNVSEEEEIVVRNVGNVEMDLGLYGYGSEVEDGNAMTCSRGEDIPVYYKKYNLTSSVFGNLTLSEFDSSYRNLSSSLVINDLNLNYRTDDAVDNAFLSTFWRIYVPETISGNCSGNIMFSAVESL